MSHTSHRPLDRRGSESGNRSAQPLFFLGCALWGYKDWVGDLFPVGSQSRDFLSLYSRRLTTVEGNTIFYALPDQATQQRWVEQTPVGFQICAKLPRSLTHAGLLEPMIPSISTFLQHMAPLRDRTGPFFAQLPPSYNPALLADLIAFLNAWPHDQAELALEVRHPDWFKSPYREQLNQVITDLGIGRVLLDTRPVYECDDNPQQFSKRHKPAVPLQPVVTAPFSLVRYISHPEFDRNRDYLAAWVNWIAAQLQQGTRIYFFAHCPVEAKSPAIARYLQVELERNAVPVPPLPWNQVEAETPTQLSLWS